MGHWGQGRQGRDVGGVSLRDVRVAHVVCVAANAGLPSGSYQGKVELGP